MTRMHPSMAPRSALQRAARGLAALLLALGTAGPALADQDEDDGDEGGSYAIGLWGDLPYDVAATDAQTKVGVPNLIADMNSHKLRFTAHDGDLKGGNGPVTCSDALYTNALAFFNSLRAPAIFTPGDNDWTDCDRVANGAFNSRGRLDQERKLLFATPYTLGQRKLRQQVQTEALCLNEAGQKVPCVENRRWSVGGVMYATLNVPGSCNNLCDIAPDLAEYSARNQANIQWLRQTFAAATARNSKAVMLITQANPGWDLTDGTRAPLRDPRTLVQSGSDPDGYKDYLLALRDEVIGFRRPVAYVHGDSHYFRVDKPLLDAQGRRLENFTRVETFGDNAGAVNLTNDVQWIKVTVAPHSREVFSYQAMIVPGNRVAVPAP
jgi:hypothetical protein